jgi:methylated-DNA-protein-cysteine methyltransferase related protein
VKLRGKRNAALAGMARLHGEVQGPRKSAWEGVFATARRIPRGKVMTYGQIATLLGNRLSPRAVGWALHGCPRDIPWHRVVNASGGCSTDRLPHMAPGLQQALLRAEGVRFRLNGTLDLGVYRWVPRRKSPRRRAGGLISGRSKRNWGVPRG